MTELGSALDAVRSRLRLVGSARSALIAISGIDGCGKGFVARELGATLAGEGVRVATINIDGWLNLPNVRFSTTEPARHFYEHAIRFDDMFTDVVLPLKRRRSLRAMSRFVEETATDYRVHEWAFEDVDVILFEGIYLLKTAFRQHYDLSMWIDCSFATALERAIARQQRVCLATTPSRLTRPSTFPRSASTSSATRLGGRQT